MSDIYDCSTRVKGLQTSIHIWEVMVSKNFDSKHDAIFILGIHPDRIYFECGCCDYTKRQSKKGLVGEGACVEHCPISEGQDFGCENRIGDPHDRRNPLHPYAAWNRAKSPETRLEAAIIFLNYLKQKLEEELANEKAQQKVG